MLTLLTQALSYFAQVFNYLSRLPRIYMYTGIYIKKSLPVICVEKLCRRSSVILQSQHLKILRLQGIINTLFISTVFLMRIEFVLTGIFFVFHQSQAPFIVFTGNKRQKCPFLKDNICKKELDFKEKALKAIQLSFVFYLRKFHVCRIMQLRCSRKLVMCQTIRGELI